MRIRRWRPRLCERRANSKPSMPGRPISSSATSGGLARAISSAVGPPRLRPPYGHEDAAAVRGCPLHPCYHRPRGLRRPVADPVRVCFSNSSPGGAVASCRRGNRTMNSLPCPDPALVADTVPPCTSTRRRTRVRPMPSPPSDRSTARSTWVNRSNTLGNISGGMPMPLSRTRTTASSRILLDDQRDSTTLIGVFGGVVEKVRQNLGEPGHVGVDLQTPIRKRQRQLMPGASMSGRLISTARATMSLRSTAVR